MLFLSHLSHQSTRSKIYHDILISFDRFDTFDLNDMVEKGSIKGVIIHEMGHVLGVGLLWGDNGLLDENNNTRTYRNNTRAFDVWSKDWGCDGTPPVEQDSGHWNEKCLEHELMTPRASGNLPLSKLTIANLEDIGYEVDYDAADAFDGRNTTCCNGTVNAQTLNTPTLSNAGRDYAVAYGQEILRENELPDDVALLLAQDDTGLIYVGDKIVFVIVIENGIIFDVLVTK